jgi:hypothetical protein
VISFLFDKARFGGPFFLRAAEPEIPAVAAICHEYPSAVRIKNGMPALTGENAISRQSFGPLTSQPSIDLERGY